MGLLKFLRWLFGVSPVRAEVPGEEARPARTSRVVRPVRLQRLRRVRPPRGPRARRCPGRAPYRFAHLAVDSSGYLDLSGDLRPERLDRFDLPHLATPDDLARFLGLPLGKLAWLTHRFDPGSRPRGVREAHYSYRWLAKASGGYRLIEAPKATLQQVQQRILRELLDRIPPHASAQGFVRGRSIVTNAAPHVGRRVVLKFDLWNFYPSVRYSRVVALFRAVGFSREAALWLGRLTTSAVPGSLPYPEGDPHALRVYYPRHLPQGAPTSPALANLSAFSLDVRLSGLARTYGVRYTRYADDLTFSGPGTFIPALPEFIRLVTQIARDEQFRVHHRKRRVLRSNRRQIVTGVVVNQTLNVSRDEFDRLKAILHNCLVHGPSTQNRAGHRAFAAHLAGRIAHVCQLNGVRGARLRAVYDRIDWSR